MSDTRLEDIVSLAKRRGFIYQGSEIYGGLAGTWDYGPLGAQLKRNITDAWWKFFVEDMDEVYGLDTAILMNKKVWEASGHVSGFNDPLVEDLKTKKRYRADHLLEEAGIENVAQMSTEEMDKQIVESGLKSPDGNQLSTIRQFNMMFKTHVGAIEDETSTSYLRPETAQGMFVNFKNVVDSFSPDLPFALAQVGRAFRNEISPRDFIFRLRELEMMELEVFIDPKNWKQEFERWLKFQQDFYLSVGLPADKIHLIEVPEADRAHYSKHSIDTEFDFVIGQKELGGCAYRTDYDLTSHAKSSGKNLKYIPKDGSPAFYPHVVEPTFGIDRLVFAIIDSSYRVEEKNGEQRVYLKLPQDLAPVKYAVSPLLKNKPELVEKAREIYRQLQKKHGRVTWDDNGNIGKRYRRQDEIGTPYCITVDFQTLEDSSITIRDRDTTEQKRIDVGELL